MTDLPLMMFAAGHGTRMGELTRRRPKPLVEVAGRPLIAHALRLADEAAIERRAANVHAHAETMAGWLEAHGIAVSAERPKILDTGGGLKRALPLLDAPALLTLNPDAVWSGANPLSVLSRHWNPDRMGALLMLVPLERALGRASPGDFSLGEDGRIVRGGDLVYTGAQAIAAAAVAQVDEDVFSLNLVWDRLISEGRAFGIVHDGDWCDVGHPGGIALAEELLGHVHG